MTQNKLFVGNLAFAATEDELHDLFGQHGELEEVKIILDRETGRSRGFAFITYLDAKCAEGALVLDGSAVKGRDLRVSIATERARNNNHRHNNNRGARF